MTRIGFVGLGVMGLPMASNLLAAGYEVIGVNRSPARANLLAQRGARLADSPAQAAAQADVLITMLPDSPDVESVVLGPEGAYAAARAGMVHIDMSTIRPEVAVALAEAGGQHGVRVLDAPVSGGEKAAIDGTLSIMVGGDDADLNAVRPVLSAMGDTVVRVGGAGAGQTVKAANQLVVAGTIGLVAEALVFLEAHGVDTQRAVSVLRAGLAGSAVLERKAVAMMARDFTPGFRIDLHHKDMGIVTDAARQAGVVLPLGSAAAQLIASLRAQGRGDLDHSALLWLVERLSGRAD